MKWNSLSFGGRKFQTGRYAFPKAHIDILFVVCCCLRSGAVEEGSILVFDFCWMKLHKYAGVEVDRDLKVNNTILKIIFDFTESQ